uniref:Uncharacterized protein n=1 Tax=Strongyloides stercoralis TaxID=6248 RepID=A0A0K0E968_STRER
MLCIYLFILINNIIFFVTCCRNNNKPIYKTSNNKKSSDIQKINLNSKYLPVKKSSGVNVSLKTSSKSRIDSFRKKAILSRELKTSNNRKNKSLEEKSLNRSEYLECQNNTNFKDPLNSQTNNAKDLKKEDVKDKKQ